MRAVILPLIAVTIGNIAFVAGFRLGTAVEFTSNGPRVFVSASGVGYYGPTGEP